MAGLFFCLASDEGAGLLFCPAAIQPHKSVYSVFCAVHAVYTTHAAKQRAELRRGFSCYLPHSTATDTRPTKAKITPPASRWSVSQHRSTSSAYQNTNAPPGRCTGQHSRPIIIRYIRVQGCSIPQTMPARRLAIWHPPPGGAVQRRAARNH